MNKQLLFSKYVKQGMVVYDVGSNVGFYPLLSSALTGNNGKVFSFEPLPENILFLKKHIELIDLDNVKVIAKAVSHQWSPDSAESSELYELFSLWLILFTLY